MKYFIGIIPPDPIKEKIASFQKSFPSNNFPFKVEPHITVKAQGGLSEDLAWMPTVESVAKGYPPFEISFSGIDSFGADVLFISPAFSGELVALHKKLVAVLNLDPELVRTYYENDDYHPHLTLGGTKWGMKSEELNGMKGQAASELAGLLHLQKFQVSFIRIFRKENADGPYVLFKDIPLGSASAVNLMQN